MTHYVDRFFAAVQVLAGDGHIKQRLIRAFQEHLDAISEDELPLAAQERFAELNADLHRVAPLNGEGPICASVRKMSVREAARCARTVVTLYDEMRRDRSVEAAGPAVPGQVGVLRPVVTACR